MMSVLWFRDCRMSGGCCVMRRKSALGTGRLQLAISLARNPKRAHPLLMSPKRRRHPKKV